MAKDAVFTMKLEADLRDEFMAVAAGEGRPASQVMRELMRSYVEQQRQAREYEDYLRKKVENARASMRAGQGRANEADMIAVDEAKHVEGYKIWLRFSDGEEGIVDFSDIIERFSAAQPLKDPSEFRSFYLDGWPTLAWPCGFDYSPQALYFRATGKNAWDKVEKEADSDSVE